MSVTPRRDIERIEDEIQELFADLYQASRFAGRRRAFRPALDCFQTGDPPELTIVLELAGIEPEDVQLVAVDRTIVVAGKRRRPETPGATYQQMEIEYGPFERRIALTDEVDLERASATYARGMLTIVLPIAAKPRPRGRVSIRVTTRP